MSNETEEKLILNFSLKNCKKSNYYYISILKFGNENDKFETDKIACIEEGETINFPDKMKCSFKFGKNQNLKINTIQELYLFGDKKEYERKTYLGNLIQSKGGIYERRISEEDKNSEIISIKIEKEKSESEKIYLFDSLTLGMKLSCLCAFDFSRKDGPTIKDFTNNTLHILKALIQAVLIYVKDDQILHPIIFGGKFDISKDNIKKINKSNNINNIIEGYKQYLEQPGIIPAEKIVISSLIDEIINKIFKSYQSDIYNILFLFLSGDIDEKDQQKTIDYIIRSSYLPLSIIVIGVGNYDFSKMKELFLDNNFSSEGMPKNKENVIFLTLKNTLAIDITIDNCLEDLRKQIIEFFQRVKDPDGDIINLKKSFNLFQSVVVERNYLKKEVEIDKAKINIINNKLPEGKNNDPTPGNDKYIIPEDKTYTNTPVNPNHKKKLGESSLPAPPPSPANSYNLKDNNNNIEEVIKPDIKNPPTESIQSDSTKDSNIKESTTFSIFHKSNIFPSVKNDN